MLADLRIIFILQLAQACTPMLADLRKKIILDNLLGVYTNARCNLEKFRVATCVYTNACQLAQVMEEINFLR